MGRPRKVDPKRVQDLRSTGLKWKEIAQVLHVNIQTAMRSVPGPRQQAIDLAIRYGQIDGAHHKAWVIDQMVRLLLAKDYARVIKESCAGEDGPDTYGWDVGIAP